MKINRLVLASTSPYRRALLNQVGITHAALAPEVDEDQIEADDPESLAWARAEAKGLSLPFDGESFLAIAADQVLDFEGALTVKLRMPTKPRPGSKNSPGKRTSSAAPTALSSIRRKGPPS